MITKVQRIKNVKAFTRYMLDVESHTEGKARYEMAWGVGCTPDTALEVMNRKLRHVGRKDAGVEAYAWLYSFTRDELDPDNPDDVERALRIAVEASQQRSPGTTKVFAVQTDGNSGLVHVHEAELNVLNHDIEVTENIGSRRKARGADVTVTKHKRTAKAGGAIPPIHREIFRARRIADEVYDRHFTKTNEKVMEASRTAPTMTDKETVKALLEWAISQSEVTSLETLREKMTTEGWTSVTRGANKTTGKPGRITWISETGGKYRSHNLGPDFDDARLAERAAEPEKTPVPYPPRIRKNSVQRQRDEKRAQDAEKASTQEQRRIKAATSRPQPPRPVDEVLAQKHREEAVEAVMQPVTPNEPELSFSAKLAVMQDYAQRFAQETKALEHNARYATGQNLDTIRNRQRLLTQRHQLFLENDGFQARFDLIQQWDTDDLTQQTPPPQPKKPVRQQVSPPEKRNPFAKNWNTSQQSPTEEEPKRSL